MKKCDCNCEGCKGFTDSLKENNSTIWLFGICAFLLGVVIGFVFSPIKKGINIGNGNKNYENDNCNVSYSDGDDDEDQGTWEW